MARRKSEIEIQYTATNADFNASIKDMNDEIKTLNKTFNLQKEQMGDSATEADKLAAKIENLRDKHIVAEQKVEKMREALENSERVMGKNSTEAKKWADRLLDAETAQAKLKNEIGRAEQKMADFNAEIKEMDDSKAPKNLLDDFKQMGEKSQDAFDNVGAMGGAFKGILTGGAIGGIISGVGDIAAGLGEVVTNAMEAQAQVAKIGFTTGLEGSDLEEITQSIKGVEIYGIDADEALQGVRTQIALNKDATKEQNDEFLRNAAVMSSAYSGIDFDELIRETNEIASALGTSDENALGLVNKLLVMGFPPGEIDIISEYGTQLAAAGYSAEEIAALFEAGLETETWNIDNLLDGVKEGRIRITEYANELPAKMQPLLDKAGLTAEEFQGLAKAVADGGPEGKLAFDTIADAVAGMTDKTAQAELGVQLYGSKWQDQGPLITTAISNANDKTVDLKDSTDALNEASTKYSESGAVKYAESMARLDEALLPVKIGLADMATNALVALDSALFDTGREVQQFETDISNYFSDLTQEQDKFNLHVVERANGSLVVFEKGTGRFRNLTEEQARAWNNAQNGMTANTDRSLTEIADLTDEKLSAAKRDTETNAQGISKAIDEKFGKAADDADDAVQDIKGSLNQIKKDAEALKWKIPKPTIPEFSLRGSLNLQTGTVPRIQTSWYANGGYVPSTTLIGMGESGAEGIVPLQGRHMMPFADAVAERISNTTNSTQIIINASLAGPQDYDELGRTIDRHLNQQSHEVKIVKGR